VGKRVFNPFLYSPSKKYLRSASLQEKEAYFKVFLKIDFLGSISNRYIGE